MLLNQADTQLGRGETIEDTARVMSRFCDIVMLRTGPHENLWPMRSLRRAGDKWPDGGRASVPDTR